jgi:hypothetical protein
LVVIAGRCGDSSRHPYVDHCAEQVDATIVTESTLIFCMDIAELDELAAPVVEVVELELASSLPVTCIW